MSCNCSPNVNPSYKPPHLIEFLSPRPDAPLREDRTAVGVVFRDRNDKLYTVTREGADKAFIEIDDGLARRSGFPAAEHTWDEVVEGLCRDDLEPIARARADRNQ